MEPSPTPAQPLQPSLFDSPPAAPPRLRFAHAALARVLGPSRSTPEAHIASDRPRGSSPALYWAPVLIPLVLLAQVSLRGFGPSLAESRRLAQAEERMLARYDGAVAEQDQLARLLRAQADPVYLERERRMLRTPSSPLLRR